MHGPVGNFDEDVVARGYDHTLMKRLLVHARPYGGSIVACVLLLLVITGLELLVPYLGKVAIDRHISVGPMESHRIVAMEDLTREEREKLLALAERAGDDRLVVERGEGGVPRSLRIRRSFYRDADEATLACLRAPDRRGFRMILLSLVVLLTTKVLFMYGQMYWMQWVGQRIMFDIRQRVFVHLQSLAVRYFDGKAVGWIVTRVANDVNVLQEMFSAVLINLFKDLFILSGIVVAMLFLSPRLALVSFAVLPPLILGSLFFRARVREAYRSIRQLLSKLNAFLAERISGMRVIQAFAKEQRCLDAFQRRNEAHFLASRRQVTLFAFYMPFVELLSSCGVALILWRGGMSVLAGTVSFGTLVAFFSYLQMFFRPIRDLSEKYNIVQAAMASAERVFDLLDVEDRIDCSAVRSDDFVLRGEVEFRKVSFAYEGERWVLEDIDFHVRPGETLALVGHTGAGKTSIINLLTRQYEFQRGEILLDGRDIRSIPLPLLRRQFGCVRQDVATFSGSLADNIRLRDRGISMERVEELARFVNADRFIRALPEGYASTVGERGATLSSGQRQLLSFARALVHAPPLLLLDEATANVDTRTEQEIQEALSRIVEDYTTIVVAHRLSTIRDADQILVLHHGRIRERGTHGELLTLRGLYWHLYCLAAGDEKRGSEGPGSLELAFDPPAGGA